MDDSDIRYEPTMVVEVPSRVPGADFRANLYAQWWPDEGESATSHWKRQARQIACGYLCAVTERWTAARLVRHYASTEVAINAELATPLVVTAPIRVTVGGWVKLAPSSENDEATEEYLRVLREERARNDQSQDRLDFYRSVFADRERAWLWWADQGPEKIRALPVGAFSELISSVDRARSHMADVTENGEVDSFARVLGDFIATLDPEHAVLATGLLRQYLRHFDRMDLIARVDGLDSPTAEGISPKCDREASGSHLKNTQ